MAQRKVLQKPVERPRDEQRDAFGAREAQAFGNEFAEDDLQHREQAESENQRDAVRDDRRPRPRDRCDERRQNSGERDFAEIAEEQARDRDADLNAGNDAAEVAEQTFDDFGARVARFDELADARSRDGDERKFRGGEECVHADEEEQRRKVGARSSRAVHTSARRVLMIWRPGDERNGWGGHRVRF